MEEAAEAEAEVEDSVVVSSGFDYSSTLGFSRSFRWLWR